MQYTNIKCNQCQGNITGLVIDNHIQDIPIICNDCFNIFRYLQSSKFLKVIGKVESNFKIGSFFAKIDLKYNNNDNFNILKLFGYMNWTFFTPEQFKTQYDITLDKIYDNNTVLSYVVSTKIFEKNKPMIVGPIVKYQSSRETLLIEITKDRWNKFCVADNKSADYIKNKILILDFNPSILSVPSNQQINEMKCNACGMIFKYNIKDWDDISNVICPYDECGKTWSLKNKQCIGIVNNWRRAKSKCEITIHLDKARCEKLNDMNTEIIEKHKNQIKNELINLNNINTECVNIQEQFLQYILKSKGKELHDTILNKITEIPYNTHIDDIVSNLIKEHWNETENIKWNNICKKFKDIIIIRNWWWSCYNRKKLSKVSVNYIIKYESVKKQRID